MGEEVFIVGAPASIKGYVVPGSIKDKCSNCPQAVWLSPSSLLILHDRPGARVLCPTCALKRLDVKSAKLEITPAQLDEVNEYMDSAQGE